MITGNTELIAHIGFPTHTFRSPQIYNSWFNRNDIDVVVVPFSSEAQDYPALIGSRASVRNLRGLIITMPHKIATIDLVDDVMPMARMAGACNAVRRLPDGRLQAEMFDGVGFARAIERRGFDARGARSLVVGCGGVGSAIAAALAVSDVGTVALFDIDRQRADALAHRIAVVCPNVAVMVAADSDPTGYELVVNATPLGMNPDDPLPFDVERIEPGAYVCDVVLSSQSTSLIAQAAVRGAVTQPGTDMLFEMIPHYFEFFALPPVTADQLRESSSTIS
jgi:shikimate dehydrogenase